MKKIRRVGLLMVLAAVLLASCEQQPAKTFRKSSAFAVEEGVSKSLSEERKARIDKVIYTLILDVNENPAEAVKGGLQIDFNLLANDRPLVIDFDASPDRILRVLVGDQEVEYTAKNGHIVLEQNLLKEGQNQVKIDFLTEKNALYRADDYIYSYSYPDKASHWFPCFNQPDIKAVFTLNLLLPEDWEAVSLAPVYKIDEGKGRRFYQFMASKPVSPNLFTFAAGKFEKASNTQNKRVVNIFYHASDTRQIEKNKEYLFTLQQNALSWLEAYTNVAYPFQRFDMVILPEMPANSMGQPGLVYFRSDELLVDGGATYLQDYKRARLIAKKTAEVWFGGLVSPQWYTDDWMMPTITDYLSAKMVNPSFPLLFHDLEFLTDHFPQAYDQDRTKGTRPIRMECENSRDAGLLDDAIARHKAPIIFRQLEKILTEETMRNSLKEFLYRYSFDNADWNKLIAVMDSNTTDDVTRWANVWFKEKGMPEYKAFQEFDLYVINQYDQCDQGVIWPQRLYLYKKWSGGWQHKEVWDESQRFEFPIPDLVDIVILNWDGYSYGYFFQNQREKTFLLSKRLFELDPIRRGVSYISIWENLLRENVLPLEMRDALTLYLKREQQWPNYRMLLSYYEQMFWRYSNTAQREKWAEVMEPLLWEKMQNSELEDRRIALFKTFVRTAVTRDGIGKILAMWKGDLQPKGVKLTESDKVFLACQLAVREGLPTASDVPQNVLKQQLERTSDQKLKARLAFVSPALDVNEGVRSSFFESLKEPGKQTHPDWLIEAMQYLHHPLRAQHAETMILPSLEMLEKVVEREGAEFAGPWLQAVFSGHRSANAVEQTQNFLNAHPELNPLLKLKVLQALDPVERAVKLETELEIE